MEPLSVTMLLALAGGMGGAAGTEAWERLSNLVRRPFHRGAEGTTADRTPDIASGVRELHTLRSLPEPTAAQALLVALRRRAAVDAEFNQGLAEWESEVRLLRTGDGEVSNVVSGGRQGQVLQARDIVGPVTFGGPPGRDPERDPDRDPERDPDPDDHGADR